MEDGQLGRTGCWMLTASLGTVSRVLHAGRSFMRCRLLDTGRCGDGSDNGDDINDNTSTLLTVAINRRWCWSASAPWIVYLEASCPVAEGAGVRVDGR